MRQIKNICVLLGVTGFLLLSGCETTSSSSTSSQSSPAEEEVAHIKQQAEAGDADAQFLLGAWYVSSCGNNGSVAAEWYQRAAEQGHKEAQYRIANMYFYGAWIPKDIEQGTRHHLNKVITTTPGLSSPERYKGQQCILLTYLFVLSECFVPSFS